MLLKCYLLVHHVNCLSAPDESPKADPGYCRYTDSAVFACNKMVPDIAADWEMKSVAGFSCRFKGKTRCSSVDVCRFLFSISRDPNREAAELEHLS